MIGWFNPKKWLVEPAGKEPDEATQDEPASEPAVLHPRSTAGEETKSQREADARGD